MSKNITSIKGTSIEGENSFNMANEIKIQDIMRMIPHRYPMLLIDRVIEVVPNIRAVALKNVSINENFFCGHFPEKPVMPGVLIVEAMAQASAILIAHGLKESSQDDLPYSNKIIYFMSIERARFRKPVEPGDSLYLHVEHLHVRGNVWKMNGIAKVNDIRVSDAIFSAMLVHDDKK